MKELTERSDIKRVCKRRIKDCIDKVVWCFGMKRVWKNEESMKEWRKNERKWKNERKRKREGEK